MRLSAHLADAGKRLDQMLHERLPRFSRARIQDWIKTGRVLVDGAAARASRTMRGGEAVDVDPAEPPPLACRPGSHPYPDAL